MILHWVDYVILTIVGLSILSGLFRGFVKEVLGLIVWLIAFWVAYHYASMIEPLFNTYIEEPNIRKIISFVCVLILVLILGGIISSLIGMLISRSGLGATDKILGTGFGFIRGAFLVALVMLVVNFTSLPVNEYKEKSKLYASFNPLVTYISRYVPQTLMTLKKLDTSEISEQILNQEEIALNEI